jgi:hypothetical protein
MEDRKNHDLAQAAVLTTMRGPESENRYQKEKDIFARSRGSIVNIIRCYCYHSILPECELCSWSCAGTRMHEGEERDLSMQACGSTFCVSSRARCVPPHTRLTVQWPHQHTVESSRSPRCGIFFRRKVPYARVKTTTRGYGRYL